MIVLLTVMLILSLAGNAVEAVLIAGLNKKRKDQLSIAPSAGKKAITSSRHKLVRTLADIRIDKEGLGKHWVTYRGWHFECSCGTIAPSLENEDRQTGQGSEAGAIRAWKNHTVMYAEMVDDGDDAYDKLKAEFDKYKEECFCHDVK
jgi:hypothetical protein